MEHKYLAVMLLCVVVSRTVSFVTVAADSSGSAASRTNLPACSPDDVVTAMTICQGERQRLSYASQTNDTGQLCKALLDYSDCMKPRVQGCQGPAKMAFDVIISRFTGEPYNCQTEIQSQTMVNNSNDTIKSTATINDDQTHPSSADNWNSDDGQETSTITTLYKLASTTTIMSVEILTTVMTDTVSSENVTTKDTTTASLQSDICSSAIFTHLQAHSAVFTSCFLILIWSHYRIFNSA